MSNCEIIMSSTLSKSLEIPRQERRALSVGIVGLMRLSATRETDRGYMNGVEASNGK